MTTWTSKPLLAGALCLGLAACADFAGPKGEGSALPFAPLARGSVTLVPPFGYCVDKRSLRASFALMARCDTLGGTGAFGAPLALITAATVAKGNATTADETLGETVLVRRDEGSLILLQVDGTPPSSDMRNVFWRAIGQVGDQVIGLALYEPRSGAELGESAPELLAQTMRRTRARTASEQDNSATSQANQPLN
ncbi:MAG: hypothetical protein AAF727_00135 [Pseudomonadota bacterium]